MRCVGVVALVAAFGCGSRQSAREEAPPPDPPPAEEVDAGFVNRGPGVWLRVTPADAELLVDGESFGPATGLHPTEGFLQLDPGIHQIVVRKEGFTTWRAEVAVKADTEPIDITLQPATMESED